MVISSIRKTIRDVISIISYIYLATWLWSFNNEYDAMRNKMTMVYGFTCLLWTPRLSPRSIMYSVFGVAGFGVIVKWMWWNVNRDYLLYICKALSLLFGVKSVNLALGLVALLRTEGSRAKDDEMTAFTTVTA